MKSKIAFVTIVVSFVIMFHIAFNKPTQAPKVVHDTVRIVMNMPVIIHDTVYVSNNGDQFNNLGSGEINVNR